MIIGEYFIISLKFFLIISSIKSGNSTMAIDGSYKLINSSLDGLGKRVSLYFDVLLDTANLP